MENKHTSEPWNLFSKNGVVEITNAKRIAIVGWAGFDSTRVDEDAEANARRIVACVNACAGLTDDHFDGGFSVAAMSEYIKRIERQRDEMLAALAEAERHGGGVAFHDWLSETVMIPNISGVWKAAWKAAIASVKGGA